MKTITFFLLIFSFFSAFSQTSYEKEARNFTNWMDKIVNLTPTQKKDMRKARYDYVVIKKDPKNSNMSLSDKIALDHKFWQDRDKVLTPSQILTLTSFLKSNREIKDIENIISLTEDQIESLTSYFNVVNRQMLIEKADKGILSQEYNDASVKAKDKKDQFLITVLTSEQTKQYGDYRNSLKNRSRSTTHDTASDEYSYEAAEHILPPSN
ncbi:hypothetical protein [Flammeovirga pacifica]|uniref:Uncharacterized protein n=1 Tax=Flammeovirga pacifica TaxID=915059 RepID=A0A1S1YSS7_FLAPC|nr:hypothetical protein [Flammeovirga pacifica]OHX64079.1 hypothetical protein NH26_20955 [Flammeovirga pacifica]